MITPKTIKTAVNTLLKTTFPGIDVISQDIEKGFKQPSFTVRLEDIKIEKLDESIEMSMKVKTYYFPVLRDPNASVDTAEKIFELARMYGNKLYVADRALNVIDPEADDSTGIVVHEFDLLFEQYDESQDKEAQAPLMKDLHLNIESE